MVCDTSIVVFTLLGYLQQDNRNKNGLRALYNEQP
jgi:hypothetical protein